MNAYGEVICDVRMLGKSGLEVEKELKKENPLIQIILMFDNDKDYYDGKENNESCKNFSDKFAVKPKVLKL
jgi:DNA-binding NtrC family response regulator